MSTKVSTEEEISLSLHDRSQTSSEVQSHQLEPFEEHESDHSNLEPNLQYSDPFKATNTSNQV